MKSRYVKRRKSPYLPQRNLSNSCFSSKMNTVIVVVISSSAAFCLQKKGFSFSFRHLLKQICNLSTKTWLVGNFQEALVRPINTEIKGET